MEAIYAVTHTISRTGLNFFQALFFTIAQEVFITTSLSYSFFYP